MPNAQSGILDRRVRETPIAVIDFETTGLSPGLDRIVEAAVVRVDPGAEPRVVFDTLVNPRRPMAATEIHGITDTDVAEAPTFREIVGDLVRSVADAVVASYNVYFDIRFLTCEMREAGLIGRPPHFCLMYLRPMLDLGGRCPLDAACREHGIEHATAHATASDARAAADLLNVYLGVMGDRGVTTFADLAALHRYQFVESFELPPLSASFVSRYPGCRQLKSRTSELTVAERAAREEAGGVPAAGRPVALYWDALKTVLADLIVTDDEAAHLKRLKADLRLPDDEVRMIHARAFTSVINQFVGDGRIDDREREVLQRLHRCLSALGWAPGEA